MGGENLSLHAPYWALFHHGSPSRVNTTSTVPRDSGDSALSVHYQPTSTRPRSGLDQLTIKACVTQDSESFHRLILYVTMVSGDGWSFSRHVATATSTAIDKTSPQRHPLCPCLLLPYKRAGRGLYKGRRRTTDDEKKISLHPTKEINISSNLLCTLTFSLRPRISFLSHSL
jgi:hypothetical protein